jgi:Gpi18-like mannosyltransferase
MPDLGRVPPYVSIGVCAIVWAIVFLPLLPFSVSDFNLHVKPWLDYIRSHNGFAALSDDFSEYAPPYLYLLTAATYLHLPVDDQTLVKLVNAPFVFLMSWVVFKICRHFEVSRNGAIAAASGVFVLPTVGVNAFVWGQADTIYIPFLLLSVLLTLTCRPYWAVASFALAVSIKLQGIFLAPFLLFMILAGRIPWRATVVAPIVYVMSLLPAALLGRPFWELITIYLRQGSYYHKLSMNAPNFYFFLDHFLGASRSGLAYKGLTLLGLMLASVVGASIALLGFGRRAISDRAILLVATLSMTAMPYVLPKMHDRFFIGADLFAYALACVDRRFLWVAVAMQISSALAYAPEFSIFLLPGTYESWEWAVVLGGLINTVIIGYLAIILKQNLVVLWDFPKMRRRLQVVLRATLGRRPSGEAL